MAAFIPSLLGLGTNLLGTVMGHLGREKAAQEALGDGRAARRQVALANRDAEESAAGAAGQTNPNLARRNARIQGSRNMRQAAMADASRMEQRQLVKAQMDRQNATQLQQSLLGLGSGAAAMGASLATTAPSAKTPDAGGRVGGAAGKADAMAKGTALGRLLNLQGGAPTDPFAGQMQTSLEPSAPTAPEALTAPPSAGQLVQPPAAGIEAGSPQMPFLAPQPGPTGFPAPAGTGQTPGMSPEEAERLRRMRMGLPPTGNPFF